MKNVRSFRSTADNSASSKQPAAPVSVFQLKVLARAALLIAVAGASLAAVAHHHGWLASLGNDDGATQVAPAIAPDPLPESTSAGTFTTFNVSGAGTAAMEGTFAIAINSAGEVTGMYSNSPGVLRGFVRDVHGAITTFDASHSGTSPIEGTIPLGINSAGEITGTVIDGNHVSHGFVRNVSGVIKEFDASGAGTAANRGTAAWRINDAGEVVGFFSTDGSPSTPPTYHGFLRAANGAITVIDAPNAGTGLNPQNGRKEGTQAYSINNSGEIVGSYVDANFNRHGFLRYTNGTFAKFDPPGATTNTGKHGGMSGTIPTGIDANGVVVGTFTDVAELRHGFVRETGGDITTFNGPAAAGSGLIEGTFPFYIDSSTGVVVGFYADASSVYHGFERSASGVVTAINPPGASGAGPTMLPGAGAGGVNEYGEVAGGYSDANGVYHGFIFTPTSTKPQVATPTFLPAGGVHGGPESVQIKDATSGATIYYTLDKSIPPTSKTSKKYSGPITISKTTTVKAIAVKSGDTNSSVATATYTILKAQTISWAKLNAAYNLGSTLTLTAKATSDLPVSFASTTTKICTISKTAKSTTASLLAVGNCTIRATQAGNAVYGPAPPVQQTVAVKAK